MSYADFQREVAPRWLRGPRGEKFLYSEGAAKDWLVWLLKQAAKVGTLPAKSVVPPSIPYDALEMIGADRGLPRRIGETTTQYRDRLIDAWDAWQFAGTAIGVLTAIKQELGYTVTLMCGDNKYYSLDGGGALVVEASADVLTFSPNVWNAFTVIFTTPLPTGWAATPPDEFGVEMESVRRVVMRWKDAVSFFSRIAIIRSGAVWGYPPSQTWGQVGLVWGGNSVTYRGQV